MNEKERCLTQMSINALTEFQDAVDSSSEREILLTDNIIEEMIQRASNRSDITEIYDAELIDSVRNDLIEQLRNS